MAIGSDAKVIPTDHFKKQMALKGFDWADVVSALKSPYKITDVRRYPGQRRYCGSGLAVVVREERRNEYMLITVYLDGVVTPLREDQMSDPFALSSARVQRA